MDNEYGDDYITITDEEGTEFELEHLDTLEFQGGTYMAFVPANMDEDDEDYGLILLKVIEENGEELFASIDSEDEQASVYDAFMQRLFDEDEM